MSRRDEFISAVRSYVGTPFRHQGRLPGDGLDCLGVLVCGAAAAGSPLEDTLTYRQVPDPAALEAELNRQLQLSSPGEGRVGLFWIGEPELRIHLAIFTPSNRIVHALRIPGRVCEHRFGSYWEARFVKAYSLPGMED